MSYFDLISIQVFDLHLRLIGALGHHIRLKLSSLLLIFKLLYLLFLLPYLDVYVIYLLNCHFLSLDENFLVALDEILNVKDEVSQGLYLVCPSFEKLVQLLVPCVTLHSIGDILHLNLLVRPDD